MEQEMVTVTRREWDEKQEQTKLNQSLVDSVKGIENTLQATCNNGGCKSLITEKTWRKIHTTGITLIIMMLGFLITIQIQGHNSNVASFNSATQSNQAGFNDLHQNYNGTEKMKK
jgi:hypothetical protein